jgi:hypothetical protein
VHFRSFIRSPRFPRPNHLTSNRISREASPCYPAPPATAPILIRGNVLFPFSFFLFPFSFSSAQRSPPLWPLAPATTSTGINFSSIYKSIGRDFPGAYPSALNNIYIRKPLSLSNALTFPSFHSPNGDNELNIITC